MLKNPSVISWAQEALVRAGAAYRCDTHGAAQSTRDDAAVRRAVIIGRLNPFEDLSPNGAELALLETYLSLSLKCSDCASVSNASAKSSKAT